MGHLLSHPITSKYVQTCGNAYFRCGVAEMQGYRTNMEDTHNTILSLKQWKASRQKSNSNTKAGQNHSSDHSSNNHSPPSPSDPNDVAYFAIYDGHSGPAAAEFACVDLPLRVSELPDPFDRAAVTKLVLDSDAAFCKNTQVRAHGCTACFAIVQPLGGNEPTSARRYRVLVGNLGDSRCVIIGVDGRIRFVTSDHKPEDEAEAKRIRQAGGSVSFNRVDGELAMSRAIGDYAYKGQPHLSAQQQKVIAVPDIQLIECAAGEKLLIMCDGLVEKASNEQVVQFIERALQQQQQQQPTARPSPAVVMQQLIDYSLDSGSKDNMSCLLVLFESGDDYNSDDQYVPGTIKEGEEDRKFVETYLAYAKRHGIESGKCLQLARKADAQRGAGGGGAGPTGRSSMSGGGSDAKDTIMLPP